MSGSCDPNTGVQSGLPSESPTIDIRCVPETSGEPTYIPTPDQIPFAIDKDTNTLWVHSCENGWCPLSISLCRLNPADISVLNNLCEVLNIPVVYSVNGECVEGTVTLNELAVEIYKCLDLPPYPCVTVAQTDAGHTKVTPVTDQVTGKVDYQIENDLKATCEKDDIHPAVVAAAAEVKLDACVTNPDGTKTGGLIDLPEDKGPLTCVPLVSEQDPNGPAPAEGEGPLRLDCHGVLWLWKCDGTGWHPLEFTLPDLEALDPDDVDNICSALKFHVWYDDPDCIKQREITLEELACELQKCICAAIVTDNTTNATFALDCVNGKFVRRPIPPICDQLKSIDSTNTAVNIGDVDLVYVDAAGNCVRGPGIGCCPAISLGGSSAGGGACVSFSGATLGPRGNLLYQARDNTFIVGTAIPGVLGGVGLISIADTNPFADSPAIAKIYMKGHTNWRTLAPGNPNSVQDLIDIAYIYTLDQSSVANVPTYTAAALTSSIVNVGKGVSTDGDPGDPTDLIAGGGSSAMMLAHEAVPIGGSIQWYGQWWVSIDLNDVPLGGLAPFFFHGEMFAAIEWHRA